MLNHVIVFDIGLTTGVVHAAFHRRASEFLDCKKTWAINPTTPQFVPAFEALDTYLRCLPRALIVCETPRLDPRYVDETMLAKVEFWMQFAYSIKRDTHSELRLIQAAQWKPYKSLLRKFPGVKSTQHEKDAWCIAQWAVFHSPWGDYFSRS